MQLLAEISRRHDLKPAKTIKCEQVAIAAANYLGIPSESAGEYRVVIRVAANSLSKSRWSHYRQLAFEDGQRSPVIHGWKLDVQSLCHFAVFSQNHS